MRTTALLLVLLAGCAGQPPAASSAPSPAPAPVIGESVCSAAATCDGARRVACDGASSCAAVDGLGCRAERAAGEAPLLRCCDGSQDCEPGLTGAGGP